MLRRYDCGVASSLRWTQHHSPFFLSHCSRHAFSPREWMELCADLDFGYFSQSGTACWIYSRTYGIRTANQSVVSRSFVRSSPSKGSRHNRQTEPKLQTTSGSSAAAAEIQRIMAKKQRRLLGLGRLRGILQGHRIDAPKQQQSCPALPPLVRLVF
jgi:hypothetical protein